MPASPGSYRPLASDRSEGGAQANGSRDPGVALSVRMVLWGGLGVLVFAFLRLWGSGMLSDEQHHFRQVLAFAFGDRSVLPSLTTLPTWHFLVSLPLRGVDQPSLEMVRLANLSAAAAALAVFAALARELAPQSWGWRTLQLAALPLFLPYASLVYTSIPSLVPALLCLLMALKGRHRSAGVWGLLAVLLRQTNVVVVFAAALIAWLERRDSANPQEDSGREASNLQLVLAYAPPVVFFVLFLLWNGGVSMGDPGMHRLGGLHLGNITLLLAALPLLFAPWAVETWLRATGREGSRRALLIWAVALGLALGFFWSNSHPYNQSEYRFFLHNRLALWASSDWLHRLAVGSMAALGLTLCLRWRPQRPAWRAAAAVALLSMLAAALVEPRYMLLPVLMLQAGRPSLSRRGEMTLFLLWLGCSGLLLEGMATGRFFP